MRITLVYENGESRNSPRYSCISKLIETDNLDKAKFDEIQKEFISEVEKMESNGLEILQETVTELEKEMD